MTCTIRPLLHLYIRYTSFTFQLPKKVHLIFFSFNKKTLYMHHFQVHIIFRYISFSSIHHFLFMVHVISFHSIHHSFVITKRSRHSFVITKRFRLFSFNGIRHFSFYGIHHFLVIFFSWYSRFFSSFLKNTLDFPEKSPPTFPQKIHT